jgi:hypothetical protein
MTSGLTSGARSYTGSDRTGRRVKSRFFFCFLLLPFAVPPSPPASSAVLVLSMFALCLAKKHFGLTEAMAGGPHRRTTQVCAMMSGGGRHGVKREVTMSAWRIVHTAAVVEAIRGGRGGVGSSRRLWVGCRRICACGWCSHLGTYLHTADPPTNRPTHLREVTSATGVHLSERRPQILLCDVHKAAQQSAECKCTHSSLQNNNVLLCPTHKPTTRTHTDPPRTHARTYASSAWRDLLTSTRRQPRQS